VFTLTFDDVDEVTEWHTLVNNHRSADRTRLRSSRWKS
jgi:hypothetical protein